MIPVHCKRATPQASTKKQPKSDSSAAEGLLNCLPQALLGHFVNTRSYSKACITVFQET